MQQQQEERQPQGESLTQQRGDSMSSSSRRVQFADSDDTSTSCSYWHEEEGLDDAEVSRRRSLIWYSNTDYQEFLRDRIATIRVYRTVHASTDELQDHYCLRGLEAYQSPSLSHHVSHLRALHVRSVLGGNSSSNKALQTYDVNDWSVQRALRLAAMDAQEAQRISLLSGKDRKKRRRRSSICLGDNNNKRQRRTVTGRRSSLSALSSNKLSSSSSKKLPVAQNCQVTQDAAVAVNKGAVSTTAGSYDVGLLQQLNRRLLQDICSAKTMDNNNNATTTTNNNMSLYGLLKVGQQQQQSPFVTWAQQQPQHTPSFRRTNVTRVLLQEQRALLKDSTWLTK